MLPVNAYDFKLVQRFFCYVTYGINHRCAGNTVDLTQNGTLDVQPSSRHCESAPCLGGTSAELPLPLIGVTEINGAVMTSNPADHVDILGKNRLLGTITDRLGTADQTRQRAEENVWRATQDRGDAQSSLILLNRRKLTFV